MQTDFAGMDCFVRVVEQGSLTAAARSFGMPKSTLSRRLADLETRLGVQLLIRSTRKLSMTDAGRDYYARCAPIVAEAQAAELEVRARTGEPSGCIRISAAVGFGQIMLMPHLLAFLERYRQVQFDLAFDDRRVDIVAGGYDIAVRSGPLEDSSLVARKLTTYRRLLVAAPSYLAKAPALLRPEDLRLHQCILINPDRQTWTLETSAGDTAIRVPWRLAVQNIYAVCDAALAGCGVAQLPDYIATRHIEQGRLVEVQAGAALPTATAYILHPPSPNLAVAVRRLIEYLIEAFSKRGVGA